MENIDPGFALSLIVLGVQIYNQIISAAIRTEILELKVLIYRDFEMKADRSRDSKPGLMK